MENKVLLKDLRTAGICLAVRDHFFKQNNLDWKDFCKNGILIEDLAPYRNLHHVNLVVRAAEERISNG